MARRQWWCRAWSRGCPAGGVKTAAVSDEDGGSFSWSIHCSGVLLLVVMTSERAWSVRGSSTGNDGEVRWSVMARVGDVWLGDGGDGGRVVLCM
ncbi:hypothetical protein Dimus_008787 [Dionaea muscipula]